MKRLLGIVILILSFSLNHVAFAQGECTSTGHCHSSWEVLDYGCTLTYTCYDINHLSCEPGWNHCCYFEYGYSDKCGYFYFRQCYLDTCNY